MSLYPVSVAPTDLFDEPDQVAVGDVLTAPADRADEVVVVLLRVAHHICVRSARQIEPLHDLQGGEQLEGPENRGPADVELLAPAALQQVGRGEMAAG